MSDKIFNDYIIVTPECDDHCNSVWLTQLQEGKAPHQIHITSEEEATGIAAQLLAACTYKDAFEVFKKLYYHHKTIHDLEVKFNSSEE